VKSSPNRVLAIVIGAVVALTLLVVWLSTSQSTTEFAAAHGAGLSLGHDPT